MRPDFDVENEVEKRRLLKIVLEPSWVDLGSSWVPSWGQNRAPALGGARFSENRLFGENEGSRSDLRRFWANLAPKMAPKWVPKRPQNEQKINMKKQRKKHRKKRPTWLQNASQMPPQNDTKTNKKTRRKENTKNIRKKKPTWTKT